MMKDHYLYACSRAGISVDYVMSYTSDVMSYTSDVMSYTSDVMSYTNDVMSYTLEQCCSECCIRVSHVSCEGVMSRVSDSCDV